MKLAIGCCENTSRPSGSLPVTGRGLPTNVAIHDLSPYFYDFGFRWLGADLSSEMLVENDQMHRGAEIPGLYVIRGSVVSAIVPGLSTEQASTVSSTVTINFVSEAIKCEEAGNLRGALRSIYENAERLMQFGLFSELDAELASSDLERAGTDLLLGILTATLPRKSMLPSRKRLFRETKRILKRRGHYERGLLSGLK